MPVAQTEKTEKHLKEDVVLCNCSSIEHQFSFSYNPEEKEIYLSVFLNQYRTWWQRVWVGIKYVFGYNSKYGHWDSVSLDRKDVVELRDNFNKFLDEVKDEV